MKNNFENSIKDSLENHEMPYEAGAWEKFDKAQTPNPFYKSKWMIGGAALIAILASITLYNVEFGSADKQLNKENNNQPIAQLPEGGVDFYTDNSIVEKKSPWLNMNCVRLFIDTVNPYVFEQIDIEPLTITWNSHDIKLPEINEEEIRDTTDLEGWIVPTPNETKTDGNGAENLNPTPEVDSSKIKAEEPESPKKADPVQNLELAIPSPSFFIENTVCEGNDIVLVAEKTEEDYDYWWKLNENEIVSGKIVTIKATEIGDNKATLYIGKKGLQLAKTEKTFTVLEAPRNYVSIELNQNSLVNKWEFEMDNAFDQVVWNFGDGTKSTKKNPSHTYKEARNYTCNYTFTSSNGCASTYKRNIEVINYYNLRTDYGFSPGTRDNLNDNFIPVEIKELNVPFEFKVYARNGQLIYTSTSVDQPWDGRMKDGSTCPFGSYIWVLTLTNELGQEEVYKGTVTNVGN